MREKNKASHKRRLRIAAVFCILSVTVFFISIAFSHDPFIWTGLSCFILLVSFSIICQTSKRKIILVNMSAVVFALTLFEVYAWMKLSDAGTSVYADKSVSMNDSYHADDRTVYASKGRHKRTFLESHDFLGYRPYENNEVTVSRYFKDELMYNVTYSIDEMGLRKSADSAGPGVSPVCVLFFGGSYTFGEGLNDHETLPFQVGLISDGKYKTYNFAFNGYGPHQMLSALEHKLVENAAPCMNKTVFAIYSAHFDHVNRSAGLSVWDSHGPRYIFNKKGEIEFAGNFDFENRILKMSNIYKLAFMKRQSSNDDHIDLFTAIVSEAKRRFEIIYPGGSFSVILWDDNVFEGENAKMLSGLRRKEVAVFLVSEIIRDYHQDKYQYFISRNDPHPNARANRMIAEFIVRNILRK